MLISILLSLKLDLGAGITHWIKLLLSMPASQIQVPGSSPASTSEPASCYCV